MSMSEKPIQIFCSVAPEDELFSSQLHNHLRLLEQQRVLAIWYRHRVHAGTDWTVERDAQLARASMVLLLISPFFFACESCYQVEMPIALQRQQAGQAHVIPILLRPMDWPVAPFAHLTILPKNALPITQWRNRDEAFSQVAAGLRQVIEELAQSNKQRPHSLQSRIWMVPYERNPHFTGRDALLEQLVHRLSPEEQGLGYVALTQPQAMTGLGGIGKTQVAIEYAYRSRDLDRYTHTFWVNAASEEAIFASFAMIAELLPSVSFTSETDQHKLVEAVKRWLEQCQERWLLIFDNADDIALIRVYLPHLGNGSILLTTRAHAVASLATPVEVETMGFIEGTHLLLRRAQRLEYATDEEINQAGNIVMALDYFPLALDQAGAFIEETGCSYDQYLQMYQSHRKKLLAERGSQTTGYPHSVATTWSLSFQKVEQANPAAAELLRLCAFLAPDIIPEELIREGAAYWTPSLQQATMDLFAFNKMIAELLKFSLVKRLIESQALSIHRLVQDIQKDAMESDIQCLWAEKVVRAVNKVFPANPQDIALWPQCLRYLSQVQACHALIEHYQLQFTDVADLFIRTTVYLDKHALYTLAEPLCQRALSIREQQLGARHPDTATVLGNLAGLYQFQGKYKQAEPLYQQAISILEERFGLEHPSTATFLNNLAGLYQAQGKYKQAESHYLQSLSIREQQLGTSHPDTASTIDNLARLYQLQGKYEQAEHLSQRALSIYEQQLGVKHFDTAISLNNLAEVYRAQGKYEQAEPLYQRALFILEEQLGLEHPSTIAILNNQAGLYRAQGKYVEAEPLYQRALHIREQNMDSDHLPVATSLNNLATLYQAQGKYVEAEPLYQRALSILEQQLGPKHPILATILNNIAEFYLDQNRYEQAESLCQRALSIRKQQLGANHPDTAMSLNCLAGIYRAQGKYEQAKPLYRRALSILKQQLGAEHPSTQAIRENHVSLLQKIKHTNNRNKT